MSHLLGWLGGLGPRGLPEEEMFGGLQIEQGLAGGQRS